MRKFPGPKPTPLIDRIARNVALDDSGCLIWLGPKDKRGYGAMRINRGREGLPPTTKRPYRVLYELVVGPIPDGFDIDHLCRQPSCVHPEHLEAVTHHENLMRGRTITAAAAAQTHCVNGHEFAGDNLVMSPEGHRRCRTCINERARQGRRRRNPVRAWAEENGYVLSKFANIPTHIREAYEASLKEAS